MKAKVSQIERFMDKDWETETIFPSLSITVKLKKKKVLNLMEEISLPWKSHIKL